MNRLSISLLVVILLLQCAILRHLALVGKPERVVETVYTDILQLPYAATISHATFLQGITLAPYVNIADSTIHAKGGEACFDIKEEA